MSISVKLDRVLLDRGMSLTELSERVGVTIAENSYGTPGESEVEKYLKGSGFLEKYKSLIRLDVMSENAEEPRIIEGIKNLISE